MKPFKKLDEQIEILKARNLIISDYDYTYNYLLFNNYYNVINCYSKFFLDDKEKYLENTDFKNIVTVHHFDREIKSILFKCIIESEKKFKSVLSYRYASKFPDKPYSYFDMRNYGTENISPKDMVKLANLVAKIGEIITEKRYKKINNSIKHYYYKHKNVPIWVLENYLTFGQISLFYKFLDESLKNKIAKDLSKNLKQNINNNAAILTPKLLQSFLLNLIDLRNIIAHNNKLLGYNPTRNTPYHEKLHSYFNIEQTAPKNNVYSCFISMACFLDKTEFAILNNMVLKRILNLKKKIHPKAFEKIMKALGFPLDMRQIEQ